jgi:acetylornithine/succinyldiaminopimelate/putrescine aminotransferase/acyl-coenzyme A synthetase/AMP-(fatty) acid ligase/predicted amino acid dehydrogenase
MTPDFDWILNSTHVLPEWRDFRFRSLREMLHSKDATEANSSVLAGVVGERPIAVKLADMEAAAGLVQNWLEEHHIEPGTRVAVFRLPYASELLVAVNAISLMANGVCVVLPMSCRPADVHDLLHRTGCRHVLMPVEADILRDHASAATAHRAICRVLDETEIHPLPIPVDLPIEVRRQSPPLPARHGHGVDEEAVILTTSSTTGPPKLVRYTARALLTVAEAWRAVGLFDEGNLGGTSLCPLLSHSMGLRNVLHAIWTRQATLLIPPEWIDEAPHRVVELLQAWPPQHFTGGPALIQALAELARVFPEARKALKSMRLVVSSGSPWDSRTRHSFPRARLANAFGMTETQQALSTLVAAESLNFDGSTTQRSLGRPLPGVTAAVRFTNADQSVGRLFIKSAFNAIGYVGERPFEEWFDTGDCVRLVQGELEYWGRTTDDFVNLGSGLKVSLTELESRYGQVFEELPAIIFRHSAGRLGIVALVYCGERLPDCPSLQQQIREGVQSIHERMGTGEQDFEVRHERLVAIGLIPGVPRRTGLGKIDQRALDNEHRVVLDSLNSATGRHPHVIEIDQACVGENAWYQQLSPHVGQLMQALKLDVEFIGGKGDHLVRRDRTECRVLDLVGGFGANLLGHGRQDLQDVAVDAMQGLPLLDQGSRRTAAAELAKTLSARVGAITGRRYVCLLHASGAESVETALKHALFSWRSRFSAFNRELTHEFATLCPDLVRECRQYNESLFNAARPLIVALEGGYHGKTTGALNVMSEYSQRAPFDAILGARVQFVPRSQLASPREFLAELCGDEVMKLRRPVRRGDGYEIDEVSHPAIIAVIAEPVQGEGGIFEVPRDWFVAVREAGLPLILDEIQCGLGRTGTFLASEGAMADYYLLGKSLGGGVAKISATLIDRAVYCDEFDLLTGATFSSDTFSSRVSLKTLEVIAADDVPARAAALGSILGEQLTELQQSHPQVVRAIRGRGLMWGVEIELPSSANRFLRQLIGRRVGYFAASYLLHRHNVRVLPTVSAPNVLRIEPSAYLTPVDIYHLTFSLNELCHQIESDNVADLVRHLMSPTNADVGPETIAPRRAVSTDRHRFRFPHETPDPTAQRVGFIFNPIYPADELLVEMPELMGLSITERMELVWRLQVLAEGRPFVSFSKNLFGGRVWMCGILLPVAPMVLDHWNRRGELGQVRQRLDDALDLAVNEGCRSIVFGAQTSVVTHNATTLLPPDGVQISSGNTLTVAVMIDQIEVAIQKNGTSRNGRLAIVGAAGNIGSAIVRWYAQHNRWSGPITMFGRPGTSGRLNELASETKSSAATGRVEVTEDRAALLDCDVIVVAVSGAGVVLDASDVSPHHPVIVADVSQPRGVSPTLAQDRPNAMYVVAGLVKLPEDPGFRLTPHTPPGACFACAAEAILMGLEHTDVNLRGEIDLSAVETLQRLARKHGLIQRDHNQIRQQMLPECDGAAAPPRFVH